MTVQPMQAYSRLQVSIWRSLDCSGWRGEVEVIKART
jgi:hypothetical protein